MKTIALKDAFKLFLFLLILFSAKAISHPRLPNECGPNDCRSKIGLAKKATNTTTTSGTCSTSSKGIVMKSNKSINFNK